MKKEELKAIKERARITRVDMTVLRFESGRLWNPVYAHCTMFHTRQHWGLLGK